VSAARALHRAKSSYHHGDLRRTLIDSALELIAESDVVSLSLRELSRKAGVTTAAPYHHFPDKRALLEAIAEEGLKLLAARMVAAQQKCGPDARDRARALSEAYVRFGTEQVAYFRVMCCEELARGEHRSGAVDAASDAVFNLALAVVDEVAGDRFSEKERRALATTAWATVYGAAALWNMGSLQRKRIGDLRGLIQATAEHLVLLIDAIGARPSRRAAKSAER
jgi:AcrR family transcriptional regulator